MRPTLITCLFIACYPVALPATVAALRSLGVSRGIAIALGIPLNLIAMFVAVLMIAAVGDAIQRLRRVLKR